MPPIVGLSIPPPVGSIGGPPITNDMPTPDTPPARGRGPVDGIRGPVVPVPMIRGRALEGEERMAGVKLAAFGFLEEELFRMTFSRCRGSDGGYGTGGGGGNGGYCV